VGSHPPQMHAHAAPIAERPPEFSSALEKLRRLFAGFLWDAKSNSSFTAWFEIQRARSAKKKTEIFNEKFQQWSEGSVTVIREWLPKFVALAEAYPEPNGGDTVQWASGWVWDVVEGMCGIPRFKPDAVAWPHIRITRTMVWWFAVASEGNSSVNWPPLRPWKAPRWLAPDGKTTDSLLRERSRNLWLRLNHVIGEELDLAQIENTIASGHAVLRQTQARHTRDWSASQPDGFSVGAVTNADTWASFRAAFESLSREESSASLDDKQDCRISATSMGEMKEWLLRTGTNENFHARLTLLVTQAGAKLGTPQGSTKLSYWLYRLYLELQGSRSKLLFAPVQENPKCVLIVSVCEASANFCARLEQQAVESSGSESSPGKRKGPSVVGPDVKLADAARFPTMTVPEVMVLLGISRASVYRYLDEGRLNRPGLNKKPGKRSKTLVLTTSVQRMLLPADE
jgi:hypothetical protein